MIGKKEDVKGCQLMMEFMYAKYFIYYSYVRYKLSTIQILYSLTDG